MCQVNSKGAVTIMKQLTCKEDAIVPVLLEAQFHQGGDGIATGGLYLGHFP